MDEITARTSAPTRAAVVICCYTEDRYADVVAAVTSAQQQSADVLARLLVVVDHNDALLERLRAQFPEIEVIPSLHARGLSGARNTALDLLDAEATPVVAFLDDDAVAQPGWLAALVAPLDDPELGATLAGTGGRLEPLWDAGRPGWFPHEFDWVIGCSHPGQPADGGPIRNPIGANMAFRTALLREAGDFPEDMGRIGTVPVGCEETTASIAITANHPERTFWYAPDAVARHRVRAERGTWSYFRARCWGEGLSKAIVQARGGESLGTEQSYVTQVLAPGVRRGLLAPLRGDLAGWSRAFAIVFGLVVTALGFATGKFRSRTARTPKRTAPPHRAPRVGVFTARARPEIGGIEAHVAEVCSRLVRDGWTLEVHATDRTGELPKHDVDEGVRVSRVPAYPASKDWYLSPGLFRRALLGRYDLIHVQGIHTLVPLLVMLAAWLRRTPYVVTFHTGGTSSPGREKIRGPQFALLSPLMRRAAQLIAVSEFEARRFEAILGWETGSIQVIRNGGALPASDVAPATPPQIATVGRLEHYKGHHRAIAALPDLLGTHPGLRLRILGAGPYEPDLEKYAAELGVSESVSIEFVPPGDRQLMADTLAETSAVGLLSDYEAHPVAVMEALTLGRPVVVSRTSGLTEIAEMGWAVGLEPDASPAETAAAFRAQLTAPILPDAALLPTWETCVAELEEVFERVLGRTATGEPT